MKTIVALLLLILAVRGLQEPLSHLRSGKLVTKPSLYISAYLGFCVYAGAIAAMFIWGLTL